MTSVRRMLRIRPGEERAAVRLLATMVVLWAGFGIGASAVESLLLSRHGAGILPPLFVALAPATIVAAVGISALLAGRFGSVAPRAAPLVYAVAVIGMRPLADSRWDGAFPLLWVLMMVLWLSNGITAWALAGRVHDTRQAKRLFPLYAAGVIVGGTIGGFATPLLAASIGVPNLLWVWAAACAAGFAAARAVPRGAAVARRRRRSSGGGLGVVRGSALLRWMFVSIVGFAFLYFTLTLLFARGLVARFPDPTGLAAFLGTFTGAANAATLAVSLLLANRLFARFGAASMVAFMALIYAAAFGALSLTGSFATLVALRFLQLVWVYGVWSSGWQALLNVVPAGARDGVRAVLDAVAYPIGVAAAGAALLLVDDVATLGLVMAALTAASAWLARRSYPRALLDALRAGNPDVFGGAHGGVGSVSDRDARAALLRDVADPDPHVRRVATHVVAGLGSGDLRTVLRRAVRDPDAEVRRAAIGGLPPGDADVIRLASEALRDTDPGVRAEAARSLARAAPDAAAGVVGLGELLSSDDPVARASAAMALVGSDPRAGAELSAMAASAEPDQRRAALSALAAGASAGGGDDGLLDLAVAALGDPDPEVRGAAVDAGRAFGPRAAERLVAALGDPDLEAAAVEALRADQRSPGLTRYIRERRDLALSDAAAARAVAGLDGEAVDLLMWALDHRARERALRAVGAAGAAPPSGPLAVAVENLRADGAQRADALETLDTVGERELIRPLVSVWEGGGGAAGDGRAALASALQDPDPIVRAAAVLATRGVGDTALQEAARRRGRDDVEIVREAASLLEGGTTTRSATTLSLVERVMFLRRVALFDGLSPDDLVRVAEVATEELHAPGGMLAEEGEVGDELHIVIDGSIRVVLGGREIARRGVGEYVGEMAIVSDQPRMASLVADGDTRTLTLDGSRFRRILRERPDVGLAVMRVLCDRLRASDADRSSR